MKVTSSSLKKAYTHRGLVYTKFTLTMTGKTETLIELTVNNVNNKRKQK